MASLKDQVSPLERAALGAASLRGCMRGEVYPITVTSTSKRFAVPDAWKGQLVRLEADGGDIGYQISTDNNATADLTVRAAEAGSPIITLTPAPDGVFRVFNGQYDDIKFPADALTFALIGTAPTQVARCHLAET